MRGYYRKAHLGIQRVLRMASDVPDDEMQDGNTTAMVEAYLQSRRGGISDHQILGRSIVDLAPGNENWPSAYEDGIGRELASPGTDQH